MNLIGSEHGHFVCEDDTCGSEPHRVVVHAGHSVAPVCQLYCKRLALTQPVFAPQLCGRCGEESIRYHAQNARPDVVGQPRQVKPRHAGISRSVD